MKPVNQQFPTTFIDSARMAPDASRNFNASIVQHDGKRLMVYRSEPKEGWCTLRLAELGDDWQPVNDSPIDVPVTQPDANLEDPRLFAGPGGLWLAWSEANYTERTHWKCVQRYGKLEHGLDGWAVCNPMTPRYGRNDGSAKEKNWQFFFQAERLFAVYSHAPQMVIEIEGEEIVNEWKAPGLAWKWGHPSGGTPPIPHAGGLLTFFHAYQPENRFHRRYNMAALVMEDRPPFAIKHVSSWPLMTASERDPLAPDPRWNPLVVFPGGIIHERGIFHVAQGINDARCVVSHIPEQALNLRTMSTKIEGKTARIRLLSNVMIDGYCRCTGDTVTVSPAVARDLIARRRAVLIESAAPAVDPSPAPVIAAETPKRRRK